MAAKKKLKRYKVNVVRTSYANADIEVEARNEKEAKRLAMEEAGNIVFSEHDADYGVDFVEELSKKAKAMSVEDLQAKQRLEQLRQEIKAERISYGEITELQSLAKYIEPGDVELLEWAGVEEDAVGEKF